MKFFLLRDHKFDLLLEKKFNKEPWHSTSATAELALMEETTREHKKDFDKLKELIEDVPTTETGVKALPPDPLTEKELDSAPNKEPLHEQISWNINIEFSLVIEPTYDLQKSTIRIFGNDKGNLFERLHNIAQTYDLDVLLWVEFKNFGGDNGRTKSLFTKKTGLSSPTDKKYGVEFQGIYISGWGALDSWNGINFDCVVDIGISIKKKPCCQDVFSLFKREHCERKMGHVCEKILHQETASDLLILPANKGNPVKCHKNFLLAHSSLFESKFKENPEDSKDCTIEMSDMTEQSVRALLEYMYLNETESALKDSKIAFELLKAGHVYNIKDLEGEMKNILLNNSDDWYDVDVAMRLYLLSKDMDTGKELKLKAVQLIKLNHGVLRNSECYRKLFKEDPEAAMELYESTFLV